MKKILLLIIWFVTATSFCQNYEKQWEKVIELETDGEIKSAAAVTDTIYNLAKKDKNEPQIIKAFFFRSKYMQTLDEDAQIKIIDNIKHEINTADIVAASIMQSLYAEMLQNIYSINRYRIENQKRTDSKTPADIFTWSENDFENEINTAFQKSIENRDILYNTPLEKYEAIILINPLIKRGGRSVYDFLAERYITLNQEYSYYSEEKLLKPLAYLLYGNSNDFENFTPPDSLKTNYRDILLFCKDLEKFYTAKNDTTSLYRSVLRRLEFVNTKSSGMQQQHIYINTLQELGQKWQKHPYAYRAKLMQATLLKEYADKIKTPDNLIKSVSLCNEIISNSRINDITPQAILLKNSLVNHSLKMTIEDYVIPNKPVLALVDFKNVDSLYVNIYKMSQNESETYRDKLADYIKNHKSIIEKTYVLTNKKDFFTYSTEIILPSLPSGYYLIEASDNKVDSQNSGYTTIQSTRLALIKHNQENFVAYQVLDRETGEPLHKAQVTVEGSKKKLDRNAKITLKAIKDIKKHPFDTVVVTYKGDTISTFYGEKYRTYHDNDSDDFTANVQLYLDRAIYRPGQTVYFKGILMQYKKGVFSTVPNTYVMVTIEDAARNDLKTFRLKTNEFGSFTDKYTLPLGILPGYFSINVDADDNSEEDPNYDTKSDEHPFWDRVDFDSNSIDFRVEEYKRPTFEITFPPVKNNVRLNEKTSFTGIAKSYSGATISNAKVKYSIKCQSKMSRYEFYGDSRNTEIDTGEATTNNDGSFTINFVPLPDPEFKKEELPVFTYSINISITDINGETRTGTGTIRAGYHSLELEASLPAIVNTKNKNAIVINSKNLNGEFKATEGELRVYKIVEQNRVTRNRIWSEPELQVIPEAEFIKAFPYLSYHERKRDSIMHGKMVFVKNVNTSIDKSISVEDFTGWESGQYELIFTAKDSTGITINTKSIFTFKKDTDIILSGNKIFEYEVLNTNYKKDRFIEIEMKSSLPLLYVNAIAGSKEIFYEASATLKNGHTIIKIPLDKKIINDVYIRLDYLWENELAFKDFTAAMISDAKALQIATSTTTNKLFPGEKETWSFTLTGDKLPAEVLATMYDASLDQFTKEDWMFEPPSSYNFRDVTDRWMESNRESRLFFNNYTEIQNTQLRSYDYMLNNYGFNINESKNIYLIRRPKTLPGNELMITGIITDATGMPIPGVNVMIEGTDIGVQTDFDGMYNIPANKGDKLVFSYISMQTQTIAVDTNIISVRMREDAVLLEDVVVEGYRSITTLALSSGKIITIENETPMGYIRALQGQVPGLNISTGSGQPGAASTVILRGYSSINQFQEPLYIIDGVPLNADNFRQINPNDIVNISVLKDEAATSIYGNRGANGVIIINTKEAAKERETIKQIKTRKNFNETAFFYPQLTTDKKGNITFTFTTPEALTQWKLRLLAHNKKAVSGYFENTFFTQKDLMIIPNMPRFLREKDTITLIAKISNLTPEIKTGNAILQLFDAITMEPADAQMLNTQNIKSFTIPSKGNSTVSWTIAVPKAMQAVQYKVIAKAGDFTDGEENILPVLTNSILVTESIPLWVKPNTHKEYTFENLKQNTSTTLLHQGITLEYTSNPVWLALQSLPYLMEYEHECAEQVFSRYYANAIADHVLESNPKIAEVFSAWHKEGKPLSKLEENKELKSLLMAESPWLMDAQSNEEKKNRIALLFDLDRMEGELQTNFKKIEKKQSPSGGFSWFEGGNDNEYITRHIIAGFGHLQKLGINSNDNKNSEHLIKKAIQFIDSKFLEQHKKKMINAGKNREERMELSNDQLHYLYARSFFNTKYPLADSIQKTIKKHIETVIDNKAWLNYSLYEKGMAALVLHRLNETATAKKILVNLKETSANNEEWGMYWIENKSGWHWYQSPIETQALLIEAFTEIGNDVQSADAMKVWLLKNKQNKNWPTTKATTEAIYALLMQGTQWLSIKDNTVIKLGDTNVLNKKLLENEKEAGTGYIKLEWKPEEVNTNMATLQIENKTNVPGFGGFYWQYFEELDKIKPSQKSIMNVQKELYIRTNTTKGIELVSITKENPLKVGDIVTVRLIITTSEDLEYVHLKDMRASAFEPSDVLSGYKRTSGISYYQSTRDAATHFFFDSIERGTYVLEYDIKVNNAGEFSNGITTIQSMYAPEFSAHSKSIQVKVKQ